MKHFLPTPTSKPVPCDIISEHGKQTYIEVLDERSPAGKRLSWTNTYTHGSKLLILSSQIQEA